MKLNQAVIAQALTQGQALVFEEIDSTNEYLLTHHKTLPSGSLCVAEMQTAGRGRRGRQWYSPESQNVYFSMLWHYPTVEIPQLSSLSLVVAVIIAETFQALNVPNIQIKWPNDIYHQGKKMGGILIESRMDKSGIYLVIGIGLNLGMQQVDEKVVTQAWSDLSDYQLDRSQLVAELAQRLQTALSSYPQTAFAPYIERWQTFDIFRNQAVRLITENAEIHGISLGINEKGELLLQQGEIIRCFSVGEISLRSSC
ncbi:MULTISPECIES: biotin--[acetyl-CoA-carboxylase] ligase [Glaesserella]|uniref:biotin--[biotin carboxyl-carrier protein] ligase n=1 Tax=Glaesserella australis TaxID=2094024 RepID=A0A328BXK4_9PAST|nr:MULTISPECIES: biotin--[acetyl-CoA-carboxylase] ligase [Glaesserella]AUI67005.1 biotin--[acetyl-CoA-carboxylase] ligase [Glaesserella sp. 15-184]RAL18903.1 biotin--[acetyl-CoA-carboxylase] ligase [Glaesserella australis]